MAIHPNMRFRAMPKLPYAHRVAAITGLLIAGIVVQVFFGWLIGAPFIVFGGILFIPKGLNNRETIPKMAEPQWERVTDDEIRKCLERITATEGWAKNARIGCVPWFLMFVLLIMGGGLFFFPMEAFLQGAGMDPDLFPRALGRTVGFDATILSFCALLGSVTSWVPGQLKVHLSSLIQAIDFLQKSATPDLELQPMLQVVDSKEGQMPLDGRLMVKILSAPESFMGVQVQVSTNSVQGTSYPYLYCVILARPELGLLDKVRPFLDAPAVPKSVADRSNKDKGFPTYAGLVVELTNEGGMDVVVVRQLTFGSGYHTTEPQQSKVIHMSLDLAYSALRLAAAQ